MSLSSSVYMFFVIRMTVEDVNQQLWVVNNIRKVRVKSVLKFGSRITHNHWEGKRQNKNYFLGQAVDCLDYVSESL